MGSTIASSMGASPETVGALEDFAVKFNGLSMSPNPNLAPMMERRQARREQTASRNQTAAYLEKAGRPDLAQLVQAGALDGSDALQMAMKKDEPQLFNMGGEIVSVGPDGKPEVVYRSPQEREAAKIWQAGENFYREGPNGMEMLPVVGRPGAEAGGPTPLDPVKEASVGGGLRDDLNQQIKAFRETQAAYQGIETYYKAAREGGEQGGAVADYALAVAFVKMLDPTSVAREGEVNTVARSGSIPEGLRSYLMNAIGGNGKLPQNVRDEIYRLSRGVYDQRASAAARTVKQYEQAGADLGVRPQVVNPGGRIPQWQGPVQPPKPPAAVAPLPIPPEEEDGIMGTYGSGW